MTRRPWAGLALTLCACEAYFAAEPGPSQAGPSDAFSSTRCATPGPLVLPRRLLRLSNHEVARSLAQLGTIPPSALPPSFVAPAIPPAPDPTLAVSRDFLEQLSAIGVTLDRGIGPATGCGPEDLGADQACTRRAIAAAARRAFRGTEEPADLDALTALAMEVGARSGSSEARRIVARALAMSPRTIYLFEGLSGPADGAAPRGLSPGELASFLSYRLDGKPPSEALLNALLATPSPTPAELEALVLATLGEQAVTAAAQGFLSDWLEVPAITRRNKDLNLHPFATADHLRALQAEDFATLGALAADRSTTYATLLTGPQRSKVAGDDSNPAFDSLGRPGVVSLPGVMAGASGMNETVIPRRGRFLLRRILCESLASPPANAVAMTPPIPPGSSERTRFELIEQVPACGGCHSRIDKLAVPLEVVDEVGRLRTVDHHGHALDTAGAQLIASGETLRYRDARDLYGQLGQHPLARSCFGMQAFRHFSRLPEGNGLEACAGEALVKDAPATLPLRSLTLASLVQVALAPRADATTGAMP